MDNWFEERSSICKEWVEITRKINFDLRQLTVEKYSDPVHFVYELLQNAEDQGVFDHVHGALPYIKCACLLPVEEISFSIVLQRKTLYEERGE